MNKDTYSYSKINLFNSCSLRYRFYYIDKIKKKDEGIEAFLGKIIHATLEWMYQKKIKADKRYYSPDIIIDKYKEQKGNQSKVNRNLIYTHGNKFHHYVSYSEDIILNIMNQ